MADDVYDGPGAYDEAASYEDGFGATVQMSGHAVERALAKDTHDGKVII